MKKPRPKLDGTNWGDFNPNNFTADGHTLQSNSSPTLPRPFNRPTSMPHNVDANAYRLELPEDAQQLIQSQPLNDTGNAAIEKIISDAFASQNGSTRADMASRLDKVSVNNANVHARKSAMVAEHETICCGNSASCSGTTNPTCGGSSNQAEAPRGPSCSLRKSRHLAAFLCFALATLVTGVDWLLGYTFCRPGILNNGGTPLEAAVCGVPFASIPWGFELGIFLLGDAGLTRRAVRWCSRAMVLCAVLYGVSFALEFALATQALVAPWYLAISPFLPIFRLVAQLGLGSVVAFYAILKGMMLSKMSRGEELQELILVTDRELAELTATEKKIEGEIAVYEATLAYYVAMAQAKSRRHHLNH